MLEEQITNTGDQTCPRITEQQANCVSRLCEDQQLDDLTIEPSTSINVASRGLSDGPGSALMLHFQIFPLPDF